MNRGIRILLDKEDREKLYSDVFDATGVDFFKNDSKEQKDNAKKDANYFVYVEHLILESPPVRMLTSEGYIPRYLTVKDPSEVVNYVAVLLGSTTYGQLACSSCKAYAVLVEELNERITNQLNSIQRLNERIQDLKGEVH